MKSVRPLVLALAFPLFALAQQAPTKKEPPTRLPPKKGAPSRVGLDASKTIRLTYGFPQWNKSASKIDTASVLMREGSTGRLVQIQLEETAPDSSIFTGLYSVQWERISEMAPEFYAPPQELLTTNNGLKQIQNMITKRELLRRPFLLRRGSEGRQYIEIFDTREQAHTAMKVYKAEREALEIQRQKVVPESASQVADFALDAKEREAIAKAAQERLRLDQVETRKILERDQTFRLLGSAEQARRRQEAQKLVNEALQHLQNNQTTEALQKYEKAIELDPTNKVALFQYGTTLYRANDFNRSLIFITLANGPGINPVERDYYRALDFYKLKEYGNAIEAFKKVEEANNPDLSPSGSFYIGLVMFEVKKYDEAKTAFDKSLQTTSDAKLAEVAEKYIEAILGIQQFEAEKARKWSLSATLGLNYDSNILQISDSQRDTGTASNTEGWRLLQQASIRYRPVYSLKNEWATQLDIINMYTVDNSFKEDQALRNTDPFVATLTLPYTYKGLLMGKGYKVDLVPGYETIFMSAEDNTNKEILNSIILNVLNTVVMNDSWFTNYNLELRQDNSKLSSSTGADDATALKAKLGFGNFIFLNPERSKIVTADIAYTSNQAEGANAVFDRIDASVGYIGQMPWSLTWNAKLAYFNLNYSQNTNGRVDNSYTGTFGLSRKLDSTFSTGLVSSYNINSSNLPTYEFNRLSVMLTLTAGVAF